MLETAPARLSRHAFPSMGVAVEVLLAGEPDPAAFERVEEEFGRLDQVFSRFRADSELSALNRSGRIEAGPELLELTKRAVAARVETGGRFDVTVHDALVAAGYDRTFDDVPSDRVGLDASVAGRCGGGIRVDRERSVIALERGVRLDFGGIAKGYAVDRACALLAEIAPCLVSAGGDLAVSPPDGEALWPIAVETPEGRLTLGLREGAVATSGRDVRRWHVNGEERHHLIDPSTGLPAETGLLRATAVASSAVEAEIAAKSLFLAGERDAVCEADEIGVPCVLVTEDGRLLVAGGIG